MDKLIAYVETFGLFSPYGDTPVDGYMSVAMLSVVAAVCVWALIYRARVLNFLQTTSIAMTGVWSTVTILHKIAGALVPRSNVSQPNPVFSHV